ncbi:MAG: tagaturonate epimerase family protein, partial [Lentisphaeria bacterium]
MNLAPYSIGIGDRFGHQGAAQLAALQAARQAGVDITPVWNKSNREHTLIGTTPADTRTAAMAAVRTANWAGAWHLDADHIGLKTVDGFLPHCDFYTLDVADAIGRPAAPEDAAAVRAALQPCVGRGFPALGRPEPVDSAALDAFLANYAGAVREAGRIYRRIEAARGRGQFITEVSTDEAVTPQTPLELLLILGGLAGEGVPVQTIAPKFTGRFNKSVDYVGDVAQFAREFEQDLLALQLAVQEFGLPPGLKISIHSGSDKFSLYGPVRQLLRRHGAGLHLKTAGTTWLEELIGLALAGGDGLAVARDIYAQAHGRIDELCAP